MALTPSRTSLLRWGVRQSLRGLRRGEQPALLAGTALILAGILRRDRTRKVLYSRALRPGAAVVIRNGQGMASKLEIVRRAEPNR